MCLGIPLKILSVESPERGWVDLDGAAQPVDLRLIEDPRPGEYVIVHAGFAIERLDTEEADARIRLFRELR
jgi:hydrogenase expression/formation protein HypC